MAIKVMNAWARLLSMPRLDYIPLVKPDCQYCGREYEPALFNKRTCGHCGAPLVDIEALRWERYSALMTRWHEMHREEDEAAVVEIEPEPERPWWKLW